MSQKLKYKVKIIDRLLSDGEDEWYDTVVHKGTFDSLDESELLKYIQDEYVSPDEILNKDYFISYYVINIID